MAVIDTINVGGADYSIQDAVARNNANTAINTANKVSQRGDYKADASCFTTDLETGTTYSIARAANTFFMWSGYGNVDRRPILMMTTKAVSAGTAISWQPGDAANSNCALGAVIWNLMQTQQVYVGSDGKIHYRNIAGADSVLNFSPGGKGPSRTTLTWLTTPSTRIDTHGEYYFDNPTTVTVQVVRMDGSNMYFSYNNTTSLNNAFIMQSGETRVLDNCTHLWIGDSNAPNDSCTCIVDLTFA